MAHKADDLTAERAECQHDKCYANYTFTTNPPQTPWVCRKCGKRGIAQGIWQMDEYAELTKLDRLASEGG